MKYFILAALLVLSGCDESDDVDIKSAEANVAKACAKRGMQVKYVNYELSNIRLVCEDPDTLEFRVIKLFKPMLEKTK